MFDVVIVGGGPSGLAAGIYAGRGQLRTLVVERGLFGGQIAQSSEVENYPGFESISGAELSGRFVSQAEKFGVEFVVGEVTGVEELGDGFVVFVGGDEVRAKSVILAVGANPRMLGVPGEDVFYGRGVSTCATCDGFFFRGKDVVVVGGGDAAVEEGIFLTRFADSVTVVHRRGELRAGRELQERAFNNERMRFVWNSVVEEVVGEDFVSGVKIRDVVSGEVGFVSGEGVFVYVGHEPNTGFLGGFVELSDSGYVRVWDEVFTSREGVFACGDVSDEVYRQLGTAVGAGVKAAMSLERWLF